MAKLITHFRKLYRKSVNVVRVGTIKKIFCYLLTYLFCYVRVVRYIITHRYNKNTNKNDYRKRNKTLHLSSKVIILTKNLLAK